jgi:acyl-CoA reductase-like NAD-dependent aldehyde dehydrogenase
MQIQHFIGGKFISQGNDYFKSLNPSTLEAVKVPLGGDEEIEMAAKAATTAFKTWSITSRQYRHSMLIKIADLIESRLEEFALAESQDQGKPVALARRVDIPRAIHNFRYFANAILHEQSQFSDVLEGFHSYVIQEPVGVAALISPWNLPLYLLTWKIAPCLAYGCTAVCKPSEFTSLTAYMLCKVFQDVGLPDGVSNMVFGVGPTAGNALINHPNIPLISFTGGTVTGKIVYQAAAKLNKKVSLELGGKNANLIFADCDYQDALTTSIRSSFTNQGEV